jgi:hypothetical protein
MLGFARARERFRPVTTMKIPTAPERNAKDTAQSMNSSQRAAAIDGDVQSM